MTRYVSRGIVYNNHYDYKYAKVAHYIELLSNGASIEDAASIVGCSVRTIYRYDEEIRDIGIDNVLDNAHKKKLYTVRLLMRGIAYKDVSKIVRIDAVSVKQFIEQKEYYKSMLINNPILVDEDLLHAIHKDIANKVFQDVNPRNLSIFDRCKIAFYYNTEHRSFSYIANKINRERRTISKEVKRGLDEDDLYDPYTAHIDFLCKLKRPKIAKINKYLRAI
jgi:transposase